MKNIFIVLFAGSYIFSSPVDENITYTNYINIITDISKNTKNYYDESLKYHFSVPPNELKAYQDGNYSELYYDKRYVSLVKNPYKFLSYAKKALYDKNFKHTSIVISTLQCLKTKDYIKLGYELYNDHKIIDKLVLKEYIRFGGKWGLDIHDNYKNSRDVKKLVDFIFDQNVSEEINRVVGFIKNGRYTENRKFYFLTKVRYAIEHPNDHNITWYPYSFCTDENTEKYPMPIIID